MGKVGREGLSAPECMRRRSCECSPREDVKSWDFRMNKSAEALAVDEQAGSGIDLVQYVPSFVTVVANKWARSSSALYLNLFGIGIVDWRLMGLLAVEPWIQASRVDEVVGMDKGAVSRSLQTLEKRGGKQEAERVRYCRRELYHFGGKFPRGRRQSNLVR